MPVYTSSMGRWQPGAGDRLQEAALELYAAGGFEATTVAQIAARAGVTERTFFRHFADKREVLFAGSDVLRGVLLDALDAQPQGAPPLGQVGAALRAAAALLTDRPRSHQRQVVIAATPELQERELSKLRSWATALRDGLRAGGTGEPAASLASEAAVSAFGIAFGRWLDDDQRSLVAHLDEALDVLHALAAEGHHPPSRREGTPQQPPQISNASTEGPASAETHTESHASRHPMSMPSPIASCHGTARAASSGCEAPPASTTSVMIATSSLTTSSRRTSRRRNL